jgi:hypothetical protein
MSDVATTARPGDIIEAVVAKGDLARLTPEERTRYYVEVCKSVGLNPLTRPFEYIVLSGRMVLYARREAADQLRQIHGINLDIVSQQVDGDLLVVHVRARDKTGRTDEDFGAVNIGGLKGEARANAMLKAVTKAKRRVTLSIAGLGWLDETEIEDIPTREKEPVALGADLDAFAGQGPAIASLRDAAEPVAPHDPATGEIVEPHALPGSLADYHPTTWGGKFIAAVQTAQTQSEIDAWCFNNQGILDDMRAHFPKAWTSVEQAISGRRARLGPDEPELPGAA